MKRTLAALILSSVFVFPVSVFAATISLSNFPSSIDQDQEVNIDVSFTCAGCGDSYLRGVFFPSGDNYFGYTKNNEGTWVNVSGSNCTQYFKISQSDLIESSWSGQLAVKIDKDSSYYAGPGSYSFKIGRYTPSCSGVSTWSNEITTNVTGPAPTSTPTPTPTSGPTNTPTPTPTKTPSPTPTKTPTPTPARSFTPSPTALSKSTTTIKATPTATPAASALPESTDSAVLGATDEATSSGEPFSYKPIIVSLSLVSLGLAILAGFFVWKKRDYLKEYLAKRKPTAEG